MTDVKTLSEELPLGAAEGKSLPDAIRDKYLSDEPLSGMIFGQVSIATNLSSVMKDSTSGDVRLPSCLALNYCCIVGAGNHGEVEKLCKNVRELDLAENYLTDWNQVVKVTSQIPHLQFLNLSSNPLNIAIPLELAPAPSIAKITTLVLNNTMIPWESLNVLLDNTPVLEKLHLSLNNYGFVASSNRTYPTVKLLQFNRNSITSWSDITKLGKMFPNLGSLFVSENKISGLTDNIGEDFPHLQSLCLSKTGMISWDEVDALKMFVSLTEVRLSGGPLLESYEEKERRQVILARITSKVTRLNGGLISQTERFEAERAFIRCHMNNDDKPLRYDDLVAIHGDLNPLAVVDLRPKTKVMCLVHFEDKKKLLEISVKQTCRQLKQKLQTFVGLPPSKFMVYHLDPETEFGASRMNYPSKYLYSIPILDGHEFIIQRK